MASRSDRVLALEAFIPYRLNRLADQVSRDFSQIYRRRYGMTRPEWRLLAALGQLGTMTATAVAQHSAMHKTKVSRAVSALEERGWLKREQNREDRRVEHLSLTKAGEAIYRDLVPIAHAFEERLLSVVPPDRRQAVLDGLDALERASSIGRQ